MLKSVYPFIMSLFSRMELLSQLREQVPTRILRSYNTTCSQIEEISNSDILLQRQTIMLISHRRKYSKNTFNEHILKQLTTYQYPDDPFNVFSSLQVQTFSYLLEYLWDSQENIVKNMKLISTLPNFKYLCNIGFPIIFGFFTNQYLCDKAADFYISASKNINVDNKISLFRVFFSLDHIQGFSNSLFRESIWNYYPNFPGTGFLVDKIMVTSQYFLGLLPEPHLRILRSFYDEEDQILLWTILIFDLIAPQIQLQYYSSPLCILKCKDLDIDEIVEGLHIRAKTGAVVCKITPQDLEQSQNSLCPIYVKDGTGATIKTILTLFDVHELLNMPLMFPAHLQCVSDVNQKILVDSHFAFFTKFMVDTEEKGHFPPIFFKEHQFTNNINQYTKIWSTMKKEIADPVEFLLGYQRNSKYSVVFSNGKNQELKDNAIQMETERLLVQGSNFERLMEMMMIRDIMFSWKNRAASYLNLFSRGQAFIDSDIPKTIKEVLNTPASGELRFWKFIKYLSLAEAVAFSNIQSDIEKIETIFSKLIYHNRSVQMDPPNNSTHSIFLSLSFTLTSIKKENSFFERVVVMQHLFETIENLADVNDTDKKEQLTIFFIAVFDVKWILRTAIYMNSTVFNGSFEDLIPQPFHHQWSQFVPSLLSMITEDRELLAKFMSMSTTPLIKF
ncbi:hypothetical protein TVAG_411260 [Trichomonas vaginalis G3]|uniref:Uncharacterized protein n=1 Tax=Trichomonas vaginalis (strain ATCC PRA-98 / G3) TaxID=412133 RepID=A2DXN1_TRIV3|nr:hypothetical protein TVAGG3_0047690 [Trichomonas vaginalis G3]EAY14860.1 hypothetical protein TVAG_411260 [Trichomonas vaginalis G3]KAI5541159.1 hypothetical protein TVAGG3_0047690 [Trichomonas vaginalis G3]|eukprot:XP_001327083.1 hypothetical protein [Trichomonas vaginalis G3]